MVLFETGRWPSIADAESLKRTIRSIVDAGADFEARFYQPEPLSVDLACQGDIVQLRSSAPLIDGDGNAIATDVEFDYWLILGNTCDMSRVDEHRSLIAPLVPIKGPVNSDNLRTLQRYEYYKQFYVPPWREDLDPRHHIADFMQLVTIEKRAFRDDCARIVARFQFPAWALLHACLVRYLARDDGRFD